MGGSSGPVLAGLFNGFGYGGGISPSHEHDWTAQAPQWAGTTLRASSSTATALWREGPELQPQPLRVGRGVALWPTPSSSFLNDEDAVHHGSGGSGVEGAPEDGTGGTGGGGRAGAAAGAGAGAGADLIPSSSSSTSTSEGAFSSGRDAKVGQERPREDQGLDETRLQLRTLTKTSDEDLKNEMEEIETQRNKAFLRGDPLADFEEADTIGTKAHQLMVAGDYDDGPPYPITGFASPKWMRQGGEATNNEWVVRKNTKLGSGKSYPRVTCWIGAKEHPCKPCTQEEEEATKDMVEAEKEVQSEVAQEAATEVKGPGTPREQQMPDGLLLCAAALQSSSQRLRAPAKQLQLQPSRWLLPQQHEKLKPTLRQGLRLCDESLLRAFL